MTENKKAQLVTAEQLPGVWRWEADNLLHGENDQSNRAISAAKRACASQLEAALRATHLIEPVAFWWERDLVEGAPEKGCVMGLQLFAEDAPKDADRIKPLVFAAALAQQAPQTVVDAFEVFRIAGGDVECDPRPTAERALDCLRDLRQCYDLAAAAQAPQPVVGGDAWPDPIVRFNDDGTLDEVVGVGEYHLEQMAAGHWWMQLGPHHVNLHAKGKIKANFGDREAHGNNRLLRPPPA